jgi:hypothetical protein
LPDGISRRPIALIVGQRVVDAPGGVEGDARQAADLRTVECRAGRHDDFPEELDVDNGLGTSAIIGKRRRK